MRRSRPKLFFFFFLPSFLLSSSSSSSFLRARLSSQHQLCQHNIGRDCCQLFFFHFLTVDNAGTCNAPPADILYLLPFILHTASSPFRRAYGKHLTAHAFRRAVYQTRGTGGVPSSRCVSYTVCCDCSRVHPDRGCHACSAGCEEAARGGRDSSRRAGRRRRHRTRL